MGGQDGRVVPHLRDAGGDIAPRLVLLAVVLLAINFRSVVASLPPLLPDIRRDLELSAAAAGLMTTLPVLCFGALAPLAPALTRRRPIETVLVVCALLTAAGAALRGVGGIAALFAGALLAGGAVAVAQVAVPGFIRAAHAQATGRLMGAFSMALPIGATVGAVAAVPLAQAANDSWRFSLAFWALPALLAAAACTRLGRSPPAAGVAPRHDGGRCGGEPGRWWRSSASSRWRSTRASRGSRRSCRPRDGPPARPERCRRSPTSSRPPPPSPFRSSRRAGVPPGRLLVAVVVLAGGGVAGLLAWPGAAPVWMLAVGLGQGGLLGLGLMLPTLGATDAEDVTRLTAATFTGGYLIASVGPSLCGLGHDTTGGWELPLAGLLAVTLATLVPGFLSIRPTARSADRLSLAERDPVGAVHPQVIEHAAARLAQAQAVDERRIPPAGEAVREQRGASRRALDRRGRVHRRRCSPDARRASRAARGRRPAGPRRAPRGARAPTR